MATIYGYRLLGFLPVHSREGLKSLLHAIVNYEGGTKPLEFSKLDIPQFGFIIFLLAMLGFIKALKKEKLHPALLAGVLFGLLFYTYMYYWTFFTAGILLFLIAAVFKKDMRRIKSVCACLLAAALVSALHY